MTDIAAEKYTKIDVKALRDKLVQLMAICTQPERLVQWYMYDVIDSGTKQLTGQIELLSDEGKVKAIYTPSDSGEKPVEGDKAVANEKAAADVKTDPTKPGEIPAPAVETTAVVAVQSGPVELPLTSMTNAHEFFKSIGMHVHTFTEKRRETWQVGEARVHIDVLPWLEPMLVIENGADLPAKLGLDGGSKTTESIEQIYIKRYEVEPSLFINTQELKFMQRPSWVK